MKRRDFIRIAALGAGAALTGAKVLRGEPSPAAAPAAPGRPATMVGMPISVAPLAEGDLDALFDDMRRRAGVNALFPFIY